MADSERRPSGGGILETQIHGALVEVAGMGVLLVGPSGIGKSECALELIRRGHRLVADDLVRLRPTEDARHLVGTAPDLIRHFIEIRGIGILYVPDLYGAESVVSECEVAVLIRLETGRRDAEYDRVGLERAVESVAGVDVPLLVLPLRPAASMATLVEVAAREVARRRTGTSAAELIDQRIVRLHEALPGVSGKGGER